MLKSALVTIASTVAAVANTSVLAKTKILKQHPTLREHPTPQANGPSQSSNLLYCHLNVHPFTLPSPREPQVLSETRSTQQISATSANKPVCKFLS